MGIKIENGNNRIGLLVVILIFLVSYITTIYIFWPGIMTVDSLRQFNQAVSGVYSDWHPPVMVWLWSLLNNLLSGPELMMLLQVTLYWLSLFVLGVLWINISPVISLLFCLVGWAPFTINFVGVVWKDVGLAVSWLFSMALIYALRKRKVNKLNFLLLAVSLVMFLYGALVRANAIFAAAPLLMFFLGWRNIFTVKSISIFFVVPVFLFFLTLFFNQSVFRAQKDYVVNALFIFDIGAVSSEVGENLFPVRFTEKQERRIVSDCYSPLYWNNYNSGKRCGFVVDTLKRNDKWNSYSLFNKWVAVIIDHPVHYLASRLNYYATFLRLKDKKPFYIFQRHQFTWEGDNIVAGQGNFLLESLEKIVFWEKMKLFFRPYFWLILPVCVLMGCAKMPSGVEKDFVVSLNVSALMYIMSYFIVGVAGDFRYIYWTILACSVSIVILSGVFWAQARRLYGINIRNSSS